MALFSSSFFRPSRFLKALGGLLFILAFILLSPFWSEAAACPVTDGGVGDGDGSANGTITINASTSWTPPATRGDFWDCTGKTVHVTGGATLTFSTVTTSGRFGYLKADNIIVDAGSAISSDALGCTAPGSNGNGFGPNTSTGICTVSTAGFGSGGSGTTQTGGSGGYGGAAGIGATSAYTAGTSYGNRILPNLFGSSAGRGSNMAGGSGGGIVWLHVTGTLTLNGEITADGSQGSHAAGAAGSGGSVMLLANTLAGSTGAITASGAAGKTDGSTYSGGGGGGRVAVMYGTDSSTWLGSASASTVAAGGSGSGSTSTAGSTGTLFLSNSYDPTFAYGEITDADADLRIDTITLAFDRDLDGATVSAGDFSLNNGYSISSASETSAGIVTLNVTERSFVDVERDITVTLSGSITDIFGISVTSDSLYIPSSNCPFIDGGASDDDGLLNGSYTVSSAVTLAPENEYRLNCKGLDLVVNGTVTFTGETTTTGNYSHLRADDIVLGSSGVFLATEKGCQGVAQSAREPGLDNVCAANALSSGSGSSGAGGGGTSQDRGGGGAYGGNGGQGGSATALAGFLGGTSYGSSTTPLLFGSTGGGTPGSRGGHAGGIVAVTASGTFTWSGSILSRGGDGTGTSGSAAGGGGSGGSVYIQAMTLAGSTGSVSAAGGNGFSGGSMNGGGGGGGRVAIYYGTDSTSFVSGLSAASVAAGGTGPSAAADGTAGSLYTSATYTAAVPEAIEGFTRDADADGYLDTIVLLFTEDLDAASLATTDFSVTGYTIAGVALTSGNVVTLSLQEGGTPDTSATPATSIIGSISGATSGTITSGSFVMNDEAYPVAMSASYLDTNVNGAVDRVDIVFSEDITFTYNSGDWTFPDAGSFNLVDTTSVVSTNTLRLTVTADAEETSSSIMPTILYTNTANRLRDASGNFTATFPSALSISDAAAPAINSMTIADANSDGYIDTLTFVWTENVDTNDGAPPVLADFGTITLPNGGTASSATISDPGGISNTVTLTNVTGQTNIFTGTTSVAINGITGQWSDGINLTTNPDDSETVIDAASPIIRTDGSSAPRYEDNNSDGAIDRIRLIFSENTTVTYADADWTITPNALTNADVSAVSSGNGTTTVYLTATAQSLLTGVGTGTVPTLSYTQISGSVADATGNQLATISGVNLVDFANPRLRTDSGNQMAYQDADANGSIDRVRLVFTEPVTLTYVDANWVSVVNSLTGFDVGALSSGNGTSTVYLTATTSSATTGVGAGTQPTLRFTAGSGGSIVDSASNALASIAATTLVDEALPILLTSRYRDINYNATVDRFDLTFSETMTVATCETGDYTLSGSDASGVSVASCSATGAVVELTPSGIPANDTSLTLALSYSASAGTANSLRDGAANGAASFSSVSLADATSPVPLGAVSRDVNSDGTVDRVVVSFSENVTAAHCDAADYTFSGTHASGLAISACSPSGQDISYTLTGAPVTNTALSFSWSYTQAAGTANSLADDIGNVIPDVTLSVADGASPAIVSGFYADNNADGVVDSVEIGLSEAVTVTYDDGDWIANARDLTGFDVTGLTSGSGTSSLVFSATSSSVTGVGALGNEPTLRYADGLGSLTSTTGETPSSISAFTLTDNADPLVVSGVYQDDNNNGTVDLVALSFTEPLDYAACEVSDFSFAGADGSGLSFSSCSAGSGVVGEFALSGAPSLETTLDIDLSYNALTGIANSLVDSEGNVLPSFSALSIDDEATPILLSSSYLDANADGQVDRVALEFSEPVTLTYADGDWTAIANSLPSFDVSGIHSGNGTATLLLSATATANRTGVAFGFSQPQLSFTATTGSLVDAVGQAITSLSTFSVADAAAPVIVSGSYLDSDGDAEIDRVRLSFTEETTIDFALADWTISAEDLTGLSISGVASGNGNTLISLQASALADLTGVGSGIEPTLTYLSMVGSVADRYDNALSSSGPHSLIDLAAPVLLSTNPAHNELHVDRDADIVLSFSEAMDINTFTYDISNAGISEGIAWDTDERVATIDFVSTLPEETVITVEVTSATDYAANTFSLLAGIDNPFAFTTAGAIINPVLTSGSTQDTDNDGKIDAIVLSIDQDIDGLTV
ncbi:hypothetical protein EBT31_05770, partial [bacterium]|nr:hypothetical protein [bacterium]